MTGQSGEVEKRGSSVKMLPDRRSRASDKRPASFQSVVGSKEVRDGAACTRNPRVPDPVDCCSAHPEDVGEVRARQNSVFPGHGIDQVDPNTVVSCRLGRLFPGTKRSFFSSMDFFKRLICSAPLWKHLFNSLTLILCSLFLVKR